MKRIAAILAFSVALGAALSWGAVTWTRVPHLNVLGKTLLGGTVESHVITRSLAGSATLNFGSQTITCVDSTGIVTTGAKVGDVCIVGNLDTIVGAGTGLHGVTSCYVSTADEVKIRRCAVGTADNPPDAVYRFRLFSAQ